MDVLEDLDDVVARLAQADPFALSDRAAVRALERCFASLACTLANAVASFDAGGEWANDGAKSAPAWIAATCHLPLGEVAKQLRRGAALSSMPLVAEAFAKGDIAPAHVDVLVKAAKAVRTRARCIGVPTLALHRKAGEGKFRKRRRRKPLTS